MSVIVLFGITACAPTANYGYNGNGYGGGYQAAGTKSTIGGLAGAATGAIVGSNIGKGKGRIANIAVGTLLGAVVGHEVGASLDRADQLYLQQTSARTFESNPTGVSSTWSNPDSGHSGTITPVRTYEQGGRYCREFNQKIQIGGKVQSGYGTACRMPDGSWEVQS
ncbi:MAG: glycine zipper 2TM domain-containing protein [Alphaproteobacteria bacterium]|nr:glycine zipper 2TM domain-containing protein [Alphaproteobacteria bacterium]